MLCVKVSNLWIDSILHFWKALCRSWKDFRLFSLNPLSLNNSYTYARGETASLKYNRFNFLYVSKEISSDDLNFKEIVTHNWMYLKDTKYNLSIKYEDLVSCFQLDHVYYFYPEHKNWRTDRDWFVYIVELDVYCILWDILYSLWTRAQLFLYGQYVFYNIRLRNLMINKKDIQIKSYSSRLLAQPPILWKINKNLWKLKYLVHGVSW